MKLVIYQSGRCMSAEWHRTMDFELSSVDVGQELIDEMERFGHTIQDAEDGILAWYRSDDLDDICYDLSLKEEGQVHHDVPDQALKVKIMLDTSVPGWVGPVHLVREDA